MARTPRDITDAELAVLETLWDGGPASVRALAEALYPDGGSSESATVQKLCERLLAKGFVDRDKTSRPQRFAACVDRDELIGRQLRSVADRFCEGSYAPLVSHLFEGGALAPREIRKLKSHIDRLAREQSRGRRKTER